MPGRRSRIRGNLGIWLLVIGHFLSPVLWAAEPKAPKPAELKISGYGLLGNFQLKRLIRAVEESELKGETVDANLIENTAILLMAKLHEDGFLKPTVDVRMTLADGSKRSARWQGVIEPALPRPLRARKVQFKIREGVQYHFSSLEFSGLQSIREKQARSYFVETATLLTLKANRVFTPDRLTRGLASLTEVLERLGFSQAKVTARDVEYDHETGGVQVGIVVNEGPKSVVRSVRIETFVTQTNFPAESRMAYPQKPYSRLWAQDFIQQLKATNYHRGYPDATADLTITNREPLTSGSGEVSLIYLDLLAQVRTGPQIKVGNIHFTGAKKTRERVMDTRVPLEDGDLLDPTLVEQGRANLARLGIFETIQVRFTNATDRGVAELEPRDAQAPPTRDVSYAVQEGKSLILNLLFGFGSYELLRGGFELEQKNVLGLAHHARLRGIQSFKSTRGDFLYTMPQFLGEDVDMFFNGFGLRREEISFLREEYGGGFGAIKHFQDISSDLSVRYNYQILNAAETDTDFAAEGLRNPAVGALITDFRHDQRDSPVYPRRGYKIFSTFELASEYFGGDVNYERVELAGSYHQPLGGGRYLSLGLSHGVIGAIGSTRDDLPFNKRFFPGGEYSIRGYQEGEAAPRNLEGDLVGAETFLLGSIEFEQALTAKWSVVLFSDSITFARQLRDYPGDETLFTVGGGLRWKTLVGPVRLEYGYNLNPRPQDPLGTLHFSLGFPF